jgi:short-subunit dehydrogenase
MRTYLITGASRGLGAGFAAGLPDPGDTAWLVSRTEPAVMSRDDGVTRKWVQADLSLPVSSNLVKNEVHGDQIDVLVCNAGIWEETGFSHAYDFERISVEETKKIINVNLTSVILICQKLLPNLRLSDNPKIILVSSISGLENASGREVAYAASKFGVRGVAHALRENLRKERISVTSLNPGSFTFDGNWDEGPESIVERYNGELMPVHDLVAVARCIVNLTRATAIKEIDIPAMGDELM